MKIAAHEKECGLETRDSQVRRKPDKNGVIDWPDDRRAYAEEAAATGAFTILGRQFSGYGEGKLPKPYRTQESN